MYCASKKMPKLLIHEIHFATPRTGCKDFHYLYKNSDSYKPPASYPNKNSLQAAMTENGRSLQGWGRGDRITEPEWTAKWAQSSERNLPVCFTRNKPISMSIKLIAETKVSFSGIISVKATIDGNSSHKKAKSIKFTYPSQGDGHWVNVVTVEKLPDDIGRHKVELHWEVRAHGEVVEFSGPKKTTHTIYTIYGQPIHPEYDSADLNDSGKKTKKVEGTLTGTPKRLDHMMKLIGGIKMRHPVDSDADLENVYWKLHKQINNLEKGRPLYFDNRNDEHITTGKENTGLKIPLDDQWLAWIPNPEGWNSISCIGCVQLAKTMLAAIGLQAHRAWIIPHTTELPVKYGRKRRIRLLLQDTDLFCLGKFDWRKAQHWIFEYKEREYVAAPVLMDSHGNWECFEACLLTPSHKFLPGGINTKELPERAVKSKGFNTAAEVLRWWCNGTIRNFGKKFMCWAHFNDKGSKMVTHYWDINGKHYVLKRSRNRGKGCPRGFEKEPDYVEIRNQGKDLPSP